MADLGHPSKFQRVSRLGFVTAATSFTEGQPNFARCLAPTPGLVHYVYISGGFCPMTEFCRVQTSLCVQVLVCPVLAALLHGTRPLGVSQTLRRGTRNGITELSQKAPTILGRAAVTLGIGPHSSSYCYHRLLPAKIWLNLYLQNEILRTPLGEGCQCPFSLLACLSVRKITSTSRGDEFS